ncbi:TniB family NTP-binding protein [Marinifilum caeruleilacunae]|uniref:AAA family ATPase n=1 Tax=Marinifilum caeruleilacunae TaxID=2499076 RepID=A0ABX1WS32_9BACT|nr:TniB family NTP-binding protein [Marinifilum caeruleilacunae]NOU58878.1 AAA family ATPase [Marinifilum caeruleilacunae]
MKHLHPRTAKIVENFTDENRIFSIKKPKWIGYTHAHTILKKLENLRDYPRNLRMPNLLLVGDSNNGKTILLNKFTEENKSYVEEASQEKRIPILMIQAPPDPDEKRFYNTILESLFAPYKSSEKIEMRQQRVIHLLRKVQLKMLIIDEIHHLLAGTMAKQRSFLNVLKYLANELMIPFVCSGTREALHAIQTDPQLANRFEPKVLPRWQNDEDYLRLLASFERILPLKNASLLIENSLASTILLKSEGLIGEISKILELSSILAIESGIEKINQNILENIDYTPPSERKKMMYR